MNIWQVVSENMKKMIYIEGDINDGDYISKLSLITDKQLKELLLIIKVIDEHEEHHNWSNEYSAACVSDIYEDKLTEKQIDIINEYIPYGQHGVHTITSISILDVAKEKLMLTEKEYKEEETESEDMSEYSEYTGPPCANDKYNKVQNEK